MLKLECIFVEILKCFCFCFLRALVLRFLGGFEFEREKMFSAQHKIHKDKGVELSELDEQVAQV